MEPARRHDRCSYYVDMAEPLHADASSGARCQHRTHRTVRLALSYAEANLVRVQCAEAAAFRRLSVSPLRRRDGAWSFSICERCSANSDVAADDSG